MTLVVESIPWIVCLAGSAILVKWLFVGPAPFDLAKRPLRKNRLSPEVPFALFLMWISAHVPAAAAIRLAGCDRQQKELLNYLSMAVINLAITAAVIVIARKSFDGGLKGFGLNPQTIVRDAKTALVNLTAVYPLIVLTMLLVLHVGRLIVGPNFEPEIHQTLITIKGTGILTKILLIVFAVIIVPLAEELLFRGLMQSVLADLLKSPWPAILIVSAIFVALHPSVTHWPALFVLACGLGYACEKSGSLFQPVFMHILFNTVNVSGALLS